MSFENYKRKKISNPKPPKKRAFLPDLVTKTLTKISMQITNWNFERSKQIQTIQRFLCSALNAGEWLFSCSLWKEKNSVLITLFLVCSVSPCTMVQIKTIPAYSFMLNKWQRGKDLKYPSRMVTKETSLPSNIKLPSQRTGIYPDGR